MIAEELTLLALNDATGLIADSRITPFTFDVALSGSLLMELSLRGYIDSDTEGMFAVSPSSTDVSFLDDLHNEIEEHPSIERTTWWVSRLSAKGAYFRQQIIDRLISSQILVRDHNRLWQNGLDLPERPGAIKNRIRDRLRLNILEGQIPDPHDAMLISLLTTTGLILSILSRDETVTYRARLEQISILEEASRSIHRFIQDIHLAIATASAHERNTDQGTQLLIARILEVGVGIDKISAYSNRDKLALPVAEVANHLLKKMKDSAEQRSQHLAAKILKRSMKSLEQRSFDIPALLSEVLFDREVRRGPPPTDAGRFVRINMIRKSISSKNELQLSILALPRKDTNPAKNDGPLPDLGEIDTLLRLWSIGRSMAIAKATVEKPAIEVIAIVAGRPFVSVSSARLWLNDVITPRNSSHQNNLELIDPLASAENAYELATASISQTTDRFGRELKALRSELTDYNIFDARLTASLMIALARATLTFSWLFNVLEYAFMDGIKTYIVQDAKRYFTCRTDPEENILSYEGAIAEFVEILQLQDHLVVTSHEKLERSIDSSRLSAFKDAQQGVFEKKLTNLMAPLEAQREELLSIFGRNDFLASLQLIDPTGKVTTLLEPILHTRHHVELHTFSEDISQGESPSRKSAFLIHFISGIYERQTTEQLENLRRRVLWDSVRGAAEYVASYESKTLKANELGLDDMQLLLPDSVRLSIHKKPESNNQFSIQAGPSIHRTPWHGTAGLRWSSERRYLAHDTRLCLEYKSEQWIPVVLERNVSLDIEPPYVGLTSMAKRGQPFFWLHADVISSLNREEITTDKVLSLIVNTPIKW